MRIYTCFTLIVMNWLLPYTVVAGEKSEWQAGVSTIDITPKENMWMAGYAARNKPSEGVQQKLFAKALAFRDAKGTQLVIVTTDLIGIPRKMRDEILQSVAEKYKLPKHGLVLNASHTHCGPELRVKKAAHYGVDEDRIKQSYAYLNHLQAQLINLIGSAIQNLQPAQLKYTHARAGFAMNRRLPTTTGIRNSPHPDGPVDHDVPVLMVQNADGKLRALLFGYACHNTTMGFYKFFGDYAGCAQEYLEKKHPGVTAMFFMGCGGDQNPYPRRELEHAYEHGRALANAVETALQVHSPRDVHGPLAVHADEVELKFATPLTRKELLAMKESTNKYDKRRAIYQLKQLDELGAIPDTYSYPMQVTQFGDDLTIISLAGEVVVDYSLRLKLEFGGKSAVWVAGYSHDVFGYVPSKRVLLEGGYEGGGAMRYTTLAGPFAPSVEERIIGKVTELVKSVRSQTAGK